MAQQEPDLSIPLPSKTQTKHSLSASIRSPSVESKSTRSRPLSVSMNSFKSRRSLQSRRSKSKKHKTDMENI